MELPRKANDGETYLTSIEVKEQYRWGTSVLYYLREQGDLTSYKFVGDRQAYWKQSELESVKNRPPEAMKRGPKKGHALSKPVIEKTGRARRQIVEGVTALSTN